jgi:photosystem II stability/assembly factor-like uncharacterized protein
MKILLAIIFRGVIVAGCLVSASLPSMAGPNHWTNGGPFGGDVNVIVIDPSDPSVLFAGTEYGGVFRSADHGVSWDRKSAGLELYRAYSLSVSALAIDPKAPTTVYAGTSVGLFKSLDGGESWVFKPAGGGFGKVFELHVDPQTPATLYAIATDSNWEGLYKSIDGGEQWVRCGIYAYGLAIDPGAPSTLYAAEYYGVAKSTDGGVTWTHVRANLGGANIKIVTVDPVTPTTVYAMGSTDSYTSKWLLFRSLDGGQHWAGLATLEAWVNALVIDSNNPAILYAATALGGSNPQAAVFKSSDGGTTWSSVASSLPGNTLVALAIDPVAPSTLYAGGYGGNTAGVLKSSDAGLTWSQRSQGLAAKRISTLAIDPVMPSTVYACNWGTSGDYGGNLLFKSTDGGRSFELANGGAGLDWMTALAVDPQNPLVLYASRDQNGLIKSVDGGASWGRPGGGSSPIPSGPLAITPGPASVLYTGASGPSRSLDGGVTWTRPAPPEGWGTWPRVTSLLVDPAIPSTVYCGTPAGVYRSEDAGATWVSTSSRFDDGAAVALAASVAEPTTIYALVDGVWRISKSSDRGASWSRVMAGLNWNVRSIAVDPLLPGIIYAGTYGGGVFRSADGGASWAPMNEGLTHPDVLCLALDPQAGRTLYAATEGGGVFAYTFCGEISISPQQLSAIAVGQTYDQSLAASGGSAPFTFAVTSGALPQGLNLAPSGTLSGTPAHEGTATFTVSVTDALGCFGSASYTLTVVTPPTISLVKKVSPPFKLVVTGNTLRPGIKAFINGTEWASVAYKNDGKLQLTGTGLKAAVPKGVPAKLTFTNTDGGTATVNGWSW